ncbi:RagB/SusD family nutrient uptake outer membrane protein [Daejeonella sp. H1SJ63]|uniref:RagB/SusD family nutrient uptake outer membrane protein n=1 Tax=Daejeonella sp. H1SJ63 TaxID=3034145 RepID=UPI0023EC64C9|nr:RagB/SusD family nutrient uptake outer membrane protein [Daejeonella sp. H1SJ63]
MKKIYYILLGIFVLTNTISCKKDFLDQTPSDKYSEEAVWSDPALAQAFVNNIYFGIPHGFSNIMMSSMVDETTYNADFGSSNVTKSLITPSDLSIFDENFWSGNRQRGMNWARVYKFIRSANVFFANIDKVPFDNQADKNRIKGEVYFLRGNLYHNLVSMYGGVPIITKAYGLADDFTAPRDSYENCIKFITSQLDSAAALLPLTQSGNNKGRATKGAALALKSRVLLYAASDLYNSDAAWGGGTNKELVGYVGGDRIARWQAAKNAAKAVMDLGVYSIYKAGTPASASEAIKNYADIFLSKETSEDIFLRLFTPKVDENWDGYNPGLYNNPNGWHGWGSNTPVGQMVDAYEMADGSKFDWNNPAHKAAPYANRDPRFYASINYEGAVWRPRPSDVAGKDPIGIIQVGYYKKPDGTVVPGLDTRNSPIEDWNGTYTGYYMRKFIDPTLNAQFVKQDLPWRFIRYSEIILNYAEACLALGQEQEARTHINMIRTRVGMPQVNESGQALIDRYRNERRIELAFEDLRYFDVRRWMIADVAYQNAQGVRVDGLMDGNGAIQPVRTYSNITAQARAWNPRFYFLPIKKDEMNRNSKLVQNPLY